MAPSRHGFRQRVLGNTALRTRLGVERCGSFADAAHSWIAAGRAYDAAFVEGSSGTDDAEVQATADRKRAARERLQHVCVELALGEWSSAGAREARHHAKAEYEQLERHTAALRAAAEEQRGAQLRARAQDMYGDDLLVHSTPEHRIYAAARGIRDCVMSPDTDSPPASTGDTVAEDDGWEAEQTCGVGMRELARTIRTHPRLSALISPGRQLRPSELRRMCSLFLLYFDSDESYSRAFVSNDGSASSFAEQKHSARDELDACLQDCGLGDWTSHSSRRARELVKRQLSVLRRQAARASGQHSKRSRQPDDCSPVPHAAADSSVCSTVQDATPPSSPVELMIGSRIGEQMTPAAAASSTPRNQADASLMAAL